MQPFHTIADRSEHSLHLVVLPLGQGEVYPIAADNLARSGPYRLWIIIQHNST
ncbi:hypothetical protein D3C72_2048330 [compost metagenome]